MASESVDKKAKLDLQEGMLIGMCNPLLDISAVCELEFLEKYGLKADNAILAEEKHVPIYQDMVDNLEVEYIPGGATLNSIRVAQWLLQKPRVASYFGCIGDDDFGRILNEKALEAGINTRFLVNGEVATGTCAVLVTGKQRSLVANLGAANHFKKTHFDVKENWEVVEKAQTFYSSGFFLTVSPESFLLLARHAAEENKVMATNLSAPFICQFFSEPMMKCLPYVDILFGNETEAAAFAKQHSLGTEDVAEIALKIAAMEKVNTRRDRMVIITQGSSPTVCAYRGEIKSFPVIPIKPEEIVDTNGAGDSFVGGFLSQYIQGADLDTCIRAGNYAAHYIIQQSGVSLTGKPDPLF